MKKVQWLLTIITFTIIGNISAQQIGDLDSTFNLTGKTTTDFGKDDGATSVLIQPDNKILVAGYTGTGSAVSFGLARYNVDGTPDTSFGGTGKITADFDIGYDFASSIALQDNGKIIAAGQKWNSNKGDNALMRFNGNGALDSTFGVNGKMSNPIGIGDAGITAIAIQSDGKILAAGICTTIGTGHDFAITRYTIDGQLDVTFGSGGTTTSDFNNTFDFPFAIGLQADGKIVVAGASGNDPFYDFGLIRYDSLGNIDNTFGTNGRVTTDFSKPDEWAYGCAIQPDGKIVVAGTSGSPYKIALARYTDTGVLDTSFNATGMVTTYIGLGSEAHAVAIDAVNKIVLAGQTSTGVNPNFIIARYNPNGTADISFGGVGYVITDFGTASDNAKAVAIDVDGKIVAAGVSTTNFAVARYLGLLSTGIIDFVSMNNSVLIYPNPVEQNATLTYTLKTPENITIKLFDMSGSEIKTLLQNKFQLAGEYHQAISFPENLPHGSYIIVIGNGSAKVSVQIVK